MDYKLALFIVQNIMGKKANIGALAVWKLGPWKEKVSAKFRATWDKDEHRICSDKEDEEQMYDLKR